MHQTLRMKRIFCLFGICGLLITACAEGDGLTSTIQKVALITFELNSDEHINDSGELDFGQSNNVVNREFSEYLGEIQDFEINTIKFSVVGFDQPSRTLPLMFTDIGLDLKGDSDNEYLHFFDLQGVAFGRAQFFQLYDKDSVQSTELEQAVQFFRSKALLNENVIWNVNGHLEGIAPDTDFSLQLWVDLSAIVEIR